MFRTTKELRSCLAGAPISMGHRLSWCAPHTSAGRALRLTTPVAAHDDHAPARPRLDEEAREPTRCTLQHVARRHEALCGVPGTPCHVWGGRGRSVWGPDAVRSHALLQPRAGHGTAGERRYGIPG